MPDGTEIYPNKLGIEIQPHFHVNICTIVRREAQVHSCTFIIKELEYKNGRAIC